MSNGQPTPTPITVTGQTPICVSFNSEVNPATASVLMGALSDAANKGHDEIHLLLNTPGGTVPDGIAIYNFLHALPCHIAVYNMGNVNSIGNVVYQGGQHRVCAPASSFMFHGVGFDIQNARFEQKELRQRLQSVLSDQALMSEIMVRRTNLSEEEIEGLFLEMAFMKADEALQRGIADEVRDIHLPQGLPIMQLMFQG